MVFIFLNLENALPCVKQIELVFSPNSHKGQDSDTNLENQASLYRQQMITIFEKLIAKELNVQLHAISILKN